MTIAIEVTGPRLENGNAHGPAEMVLRSIGTLEIRISSKLLYRELDFPFVELAVDLNSWLRSGFLSSRDFEFCSMESEEVGLVWFRYIGIGWRIGSVHQEFPATEILDDHEVSSIVSNYEMVADRWTHKMLGMSIDDLRIALRGFT